MNSRARKGPVRSVSPPQPMLTAAIDDPVPADSTVAIIEPLLCAAPAHAVEREVQRALLSQPDVHFPSLVVRRVQGGVCLEGVMEIDDDGPDVTDLARRVAGVERVINHLLVRSRPSLSFAESFDD